jgi:hypothetical protein
MIVQHPNHFPHFRPHVVRRSRGNTRREEAEYLYNEARGLLASVKKLEQERPRGRGQAGGWQAVRESALRLLVRAKVQPAVVVLFSVLLRGVLEKSRALDKRCAAQWAAAEAEAKGGEPSAIVRAYAEACDRDSKGCHAEIKALQKLERYQWMVEAHRPPE